DPRQSAPSASSAFHCWRSSTQHRTGKGNRSYNGGMVIEQLLGPVPKAVFVEEHYLRLPFSRPGGCERLVGLGGWDTVERILGQPGGGVLVGRDGRPWDENRAPRPEEVRPLLDEGYTIGIRHAERHDPGLAELADGFRRDFLGAVNVHVYCTPAGRPGFG